MNRIQILNKAAELTLVDRNKTYGPPDIQLECAEEIANVLMRYRMLMEQALCDEEGNCTMRHISPAEWQALRLTSTKLSRIVCGPLYYPDNYIDGAAYFALAGEFAARSTRMEDKADGNE